MRHIHVLTELMRYWTKTPFRDAYRHAELTNTSC